MKTVRLFKDGRRAEYDDSSADWLVQRGYGEYVQVARPAAPKPAVVTKPVAKPAAKAAEDAPPATSPAPRRGRPPKAK